MTYVAVVTASVLVQGLPLGTVPFHLEADEQVSAQASHHFREDIVDANLLD
jgi:hypothetical protein